MSAEQTERRRWAVTVSYTTEETYYVDAEDEDEAEDKALDECDSYDAEVREVKQIAGSKPKKTGTVQLTDGRTLEIRKGSVYLSDDCSSNDIIVDFARVRSVASRWWSNGHVAVEALSVEGHVPDEEPKLKKSIEEIVGGLADHGRRVESHSEVTKGETGHYIEMLGGEIRVKIQAIYWPLVYDPAVGLEPRITSELEPVLGVREGRVVAAVMPVRQ